MLDERSLGLASLRLCTPQTPHHACPRGRLELRREPATMDRPARAVDQVEVVGRVAGPCDGRGGTAGRRGPNATQVRRLERRQRARPLACAGPWCDSCQPPTALSEDE